MIKIKNKLIVHIFLILFCISIGTIVNAKYVIDDEFCAFNLDIDRTKPKIEILSINNTNTGFENYANKTHIITIQVKIIEKNLKDVFLDKEHIKIKIDNEYTELKNIEVSKINNIQKEEIYEIKLKNIEGNGKLKVEFLEGTAVDKGSLKSEFVQTNTNIIIDNIGPKGTLTETKKDNGKVNIKILLNEQIRDIDGWEISNDRLTIQKEFTNNISYELPIIDYAGNKSIVNVEITKATYAKLIYASHNSEVGWTFGYGNYDIAGKYAASISAKFKTEAIALHIEGNVDEDFVQANAYVYTYWGAGVEAKDTSTGVIYRYGYNPYENSYKNMKTSHLITLQGNKYFQFGGAGINSYQNTDINGNNPIPMDVSNLYKYGICGFKFKLKDYSQFSIVYQILVDKVGWVTPKSDDEECMYDKTKPMSAFRIALVPKSEKIHVLNTWSKDVGTFNMK